MPTTARSAITAAAADTALMRLLWVGDSFLEGEGASTLANTTRMKTVAGIRALYTIKGAGLGLIPARPYATYLGVSASWRAPNSGTATTAPNWNVSQGLKGVRFTAVGQYRELPLPAGTAYDVCYLQTGGAGGGTINVSLNGAAQAGINANDSGQAYQPSKLARYTRPGGRGALTVRMTAASTNTLADGVVHYDGDDTGGGLIAFDCTRTGARSDTIAVDDIVNGWAALQPHLVIDDQVGSNDFLDGAAAAPNTGADVATVVARLNVRLNAYAALTSQPTVIILVPWRLPAINGTIAGRTYAQYITAVKAACASHAYAASIKVLDLQDVYPTAASQPWHDADGLHPNDTGHQQIANALVNYIDAMDLLPAIGTAAGVSTAAGNATRSAPAGGTAVGSSTAAGSTTARRVAAGVATSVAAVAGAATALMPTSAAADATSGAAGQVTVVRPVTGAAAAITTAAGNAVPPGGLTGAATAISTAIGSPTSRQAVTGTAAVTATASGTVTVVEAPAPGALAGTVAATSAASGTVTGLRAATGVVVATSSATGSATMPDGPAVLPAAGVAIGASSATGSMTALRPTSGIASSVTAPSGSVSAIRTVSGTVAVVSTASGTLTTDAIDYEIVSVVERPTRTLTIQGAPMDLDRNARRYYRPEITTIPDGLPVTDWEASFDDGGTWHKAIDVEGLPAWLVAGPDAAIGEAVARITMRTRPRIRITAGDEIEADQTPYIEVS